MKGCLNVVFWIVCALLVTTFAISALIAAINTMGVDLPGLLAQAVRDLEATDWSFVGHAAADAVKAAFWPMLAIGLLIGISYRLRRQILSRRWAPSGDASLKRDA